MSELANSRLVGVRCGKAAQPSGWPPQAMVGSANTFTPSPDIRQTISTLPTPISPVLSDDAQNRLTSVTSVPPPSASVSQTAAIRAEFFYDPRNRCILRKYYMKGSQSQWVLNTTDSRALTYDSRWNLLTERTLDGKQVGEYMHGLRTDEILRSEISNPGNSKLATVYPLADGLGSTVALTDEQGRVTQRYRYTAYGTPSVLTAGYLPTSNSDLLKTYRFLFTGREWLSSVSLNDHRNRYHSPSLGRWTATDPILFKGNDENLYRYVGNKTTFATDPFGQEELAPMGIGPKGPTYGNWGGGGWSGGASGNEPPVDAFDSCYQGHDLCYGDCPEVVCNYQLPRSRCLQACDTALQSCLANAGPRPGWDTLQRWFIEGSETLPLWLFN